MTSDTERYGTYDSAVVTNKAEGSSYMIPIVLEPRPHSVAIIHIVAILFARIMGKAKKTRKFAAVKRMISPKDIRIKKIQEKEVAKKKKDEEKEIRHVEQSSSALFFQYNTQLGPPFYVLVDTNFINFSIKNKLDIVKSMMDCLYAKCIPCITDCVMAELEKLGSKYRVALRMAKDPCFDRLPCMHKGTYADDCIINRIQQHKCYIVATCDRDLKRRIRKVPGVPIMYISQHSSKSVSGSQMDHLARYFCLESLVDNTPHEVEGLKWCRPGGYEMKVVIVKTHD